MVDSQTEQPKPSGIVSAIRKAESHFTKHIGQDAPVGPTGLRATIVADRDGKSLFQQQEENKVALEKARQAVKDAA